KHAREHQMDKDYVFFLVNERKDKGIVVDKVEEIGIGLVDQYFYELKNNKSPQSMKNIINKCKELYEYYSLHLCFPATTWETIEIRLERLLLTKSTKEGGCIWDKEKEGRDPFPILDTFVQNAQLRYKDYQEKERSEVDYSDFSSSSIASDEDGEFKGIFFFIVVHFCMKDSKLKRDGSENKKETLPRKSNPVMRGKTQITSIVLDPPRPDSQSSEDEKTETRKQDTVTNVIASMAESEFIARWFTSSEFYDVFCKLFLDRVSSDCPKDIHACERILRTSRHPSSKSKMFHRQKKYNGRIFSASYYYCFPIKQCNICNSNK
ncbi:hypothetical protein RFI_00356, partial [Reticulomyxa filosa]